MIRFLSDFFHFPFKVKTLISDREKYLKLKWIKFSGDMDASLLI